MSPNPSKNRYSPCYTNQELLKILFPALFLLSVSSVAPLCPILCDPMDCSMPGFPVHHQLPELTQTHVHQAGDAIQPSHTLSSPSPPSFSLAKPWYRYQTKRVLRKGEVKEERKKGKEERKKGKEKSRKKLWLNLIYEHRYQNPK